MQNATAAPQQTVEQVWNGFFLANSAFVSLACLQKELPPDIPVLLKPFTRQELLGLVAAALVARGRAPAAVAATGVGERS